MDKSGLASSFQQTIEMVTALYNDAERHNKMLEMMQQTVCHLSLQLEESELAHQTLVAQAENLMQAMELEKNIPMAEYVRNTLQLLSRQRYIASLTLTHAHAGLEAGSASSAEGAAAPDPLQSWLPEAPVNTTAEGAVEHRVLAEENRPQDSLGRLRASWAGQIYIRHLKRITFARQLAFWIWRNGYPFYINHIATHLGKGKLRKWRPLVPLSSFGKINHLTRYELSAPAVVDTPVPRVVPSCDQSYLQSPHERYEFPSLSVTVLKNATAYANTNLVLVDGKVICHDLFDVERDYTSEELHGRILIDPKSRRCRWLVSDAAPVSFDVVASFFDACAPNYAHWLTEVLPRIAVYCADSRFKDVPIAVNDGLHKNIMESLRLVVGNDRRIITVAAGKALLVKELHLMSVAGYVPFDRRDPKLRGHSHGKFSPSAIELIRNHLYGVTSDDTKEQWPEKVFLRRNSGVRKVANATALEELMVTRGYVIVEPEKLSFKQQVHLFRNAKSIVGSSGAALANIIFAKKDANISIFISKYPDTSYWYWQNMASAAGARINYVLGNIASDGKEESIHSDFHIDLDKLALEKDESL